MPDFFKKIKNIFRDKVGEADKRVREQILKGCDWNAIDKDVLPDGGGGARIGAVVDAIITAQNWKLLTPLAEKAGDWLPLVDLVYRKGEFGPVPATRAAEMEEIYKAFDIARNGKQVKETFVNLVATWSCQRDSEQCYDWAVKKFEFKAVQPLGLAALCEKPIDGNPLPMKVLATSADLDRAQAAIDWIYSGNSGDRDTASDNLATWRKKLDDRNNKPPAPPLGNGGFKP
jgi:hypothetical protein